MQDKINKVFNVNNIEFLKTLPENSIDLLCTDVPYGLHDGKLSALEMIFEGKNNTKGFCNKEWDVLPTIEMLSECYRVLKEGSFFVTTFTARQDLNAVFLTRLMQAGFDASFAPMQWCYLSGFMKGLNIAKSIDRKFGAEREVLGYYIAPDGKKNQCNSSSIFNAGAEILLTSDTTDEAKYCSGLYSYSFKPANEPIIIVQKPYKAKSLTQHTIDWYNERQEYLKQGITETDLCFYTKRHSGGARVNGNDMFDSAFSSKIPVENEILSAGGRGNHTPGENYGYKQQGDVNIDNLARCPATILVSDNCLDRGRETKGTGRNSQIISGGFATSHKYASQSDLKDSGDLSRYFSLDLWTKKHLPELYKLSKKCLQLEEDVKKTGDFLFVAKPDVNIKSVGLENNNNLNTHLTCKPIDLFCYLVNIFSHPHDIVLDPFCGSGTTCIASTLIDRKYIGLELSKEYAEIATQRIAGWEVSKDIITKRKNGQSANETMQESKIVKNKEDLKLNQDYLF